MGCVDIVVLWYKIIMVEDVEWMCCYYLEDLVEKVFGGCVEICFVDGLIVVDEIVVVDVYFFGVCLFVCENYIVKFCLLVEFVFEFVEIEWFFVFV